VWHGRAVNLRSTRIPNVVISSKEKKEIADRRSNWRRVKKQQQTWVTEEKAKEESTQKSCWYTVAGASGSRFL